jgi:YVTN family beta-propeller protein
VRRAVLAGALAATVAALAGCSKPGPTSQVFVTNELSGDLTIIDGSSRQLLGVVPLGKRPRGIRPSPDHRFLYIALSGWPLSPPGVDESKLPPPDRAADGVGVFDVKSRALVTVMRGVTNPEQLAVGADGLVYAAREDTNQVVVLDPETRSARAAIPVGDQPEGLAASPDGKTLYVTLEDDNQLAVVDLASRKVTGKIAVGRRPRSVAFSPDGTRAWVTNELDGTVSEVDTAKGAQVAVIPIPGKDTRPMGVAVSADGARVFVTNGRGGQATVIDAAKGQVLQQAAVGERPWGACLGGGGRVLWTANGTSNDVTAVDAATMKPLGKVKVGNRPWGVACLD